MNDMLKVVRPIINGSIGEHMSKISEQDLSIFDVALYIQKWADLLGLKYWDISDLPMPKKNMMSLEDCIDVAIKEKYDDLLKNSDIMAKVLGSEE